jgi:hypothetical protein
VVNLKQTKCSIIEPRVPDNESRSAPRIFKVSSERPFALWRSGSHVVERETASVTWCCDMLAKRRQTFETVWSAFG